MGAPILILVVPKKPVLCELYIIHHELVLLLQSRNCFRYVPENEIKGGILGWTTSITYQINIPPRSKYYHPWNKYHLYGLGDNTRSKHWNYGYSTEKFWKSYNFKVVYQKEYLIIPSSPSISYGSRCLLDTNIFLLHKNLICLSLTFFFHITETTLAYVLILS